MPTLPADLIKRATFSKYFMRRAKELHKQNQILASAEAVLAAHDSAEMLMRVVTDFVGAKPEHEFMKFWESIKQKTGTEPPEKGQLDRFNRVRAELKHRGIVPDIGVVGDLLPIVEMFCRSIAKDLLNLDYDAISLADLVGDSEARSKIKEAETAFASGDVAKALRALALSFAIILNQAESRHSAALLRFRSGTWQRPRLGNSDADRILDALKLEVIAEGVADVTEVVNLTLLGIDPTRYASFHELTPRCGRDGSGKYYLTDTRDYTKLGSGAYETCYQFVLDVGLKVSV